MPIIHSPIPSLTPTQIEYFLDRVQPVPPSECWLWTGYVGNMGYGMVRFNYVLYLATRIAYRIWSGVDPGELCVLHRCDLPLCVSSAHLFLGTNADNSADMAQKGRSTKGDRNPMRAHPESIPRGEDHWMARQRGRYAGEKNPAAKMTDEIVLKMRAEYQSGGISYSQLAAKYGFSLTGTFQAVVGQRWKHLQIPK